MRTKIRVAFNKAFKFPPVFFEKRGLNNLFTASPLLKKGSNWLLTD